MFDFPNTPLNGQTVSGSNGATWLWDGTKWVASTQPGGGGGNTQITVSDTAPTAPAHGALWWDSVGGQLYIYYADPDSSEWVQANSLAGLGAFLSLAGGTMTGPITLAGDPNAALQASTKQYVDTNAGHNVGRNLLHNGLFNVAQRGAGPWTTNGYIVDRWASSYNLDTVSVTQNQLNPGGSGLATIDEAAKYVLWSQITGNAGAAAYTTVAQFIEDVARLSNKTITVSFYALAGSGAPKLGVSIDQLFGSGGSPSARVNGNGQSVTLSSTAWARYSLTFTLPSIVGKTLGTNGDHCTGVLFWFSSGATNNVRAGNIGVQNGSIYLWGVQLEVGSVASPLEKLDPRMDLANCQRFYQTVVAYLLSYASAGNQLGTSVVLPVVMRGTPTVTPSGSNSGGNTGAITYFPTSSQLFTSAIVTATGGASWNVPLTLSADL
jgi:hypothetical protein